MSMQLMQQASKYQSLNTISIIGLVFASVCLVIIIVYTVCQSIAQSKIDQILNFIPRDISDDYSVQIRFLILTALREMYGLAFVSDDLIYQIFNSNYSKQQILIYMMDGLANTSISNWAPDILNYVNDSLASGNIKYYLCKDGYEQMRKELYDYNNDVQNYLNVYQIQFIKGTLSSDKKSIKLSKAYKGDNLDTGTIIQIKNYQIIKYQEVTGIKDGDSSVTIDPSAWQTFEEIKIEKFKKLSKKVEQTSQEKQEKQEKQELRQHEREHEEYKPFSKIYEGYQDFPTHDINNFSYLSKPFIPNYDYMQYSPAYVYYNRDLWKYQ